MAMFPRCLCLVLTLWMAASRPSAATGFGRFGSSPWWGTQEEKQFRQSALDYGNAGNYASAETNYRAGLRRAREVHDPLATLRYLMGVGACQVLEYKYREAFASLWEARKLAIETRNDLDFGAIAFNLSSLYLQVHDIDSARSSAEEGLNRTRRLQHPYYEAQLFLQLGRIHAALEDGQAVDLFARGIEAARSQGDTALEARGWDLLGEAWLHQNQLDDAGRALDEAYRLRLDAARADLPYSYALLGALKLAQGDLQTAARFTGRALRAHAGAPDYLLFHQRGKIRLAQGDVAGALADFQEAVDLSANWWREVLPDASSLTGANVDLERNVFDSFVETAAQEALRTTNSRLIFESLQALEMNRAASLRESISLGEVWRRRLPLEYWQTLAMLRAEQTREVRSSTQTKSLFNDLKLKLTEMEAESGMVSVNFSRENFRTQSSLIHFRGGLSSSKLFLSFFLGEKASYVWALTHNSISLHQLPAAGVIREQIETFREALQQRRGDAEKLGETLYHELLGGLNEHEREKPDWLLSLGDTLLDLPFAALVPDDGAPKKAKYLIESHSLDIVPGALFLSGSRDIPNRNGWMLAVGDPIYNSADPRWRGPVRFTGWMARAEPGGQLARLVASAAEEKSSARSWQPNRATLLEGAEARRENFLSALARQPSIIHLATHVVVPAERPSEAMVAFGLDHSAQPELLSTSEIAMLHVPGAVVAMTGCASGVGQVLSGAGLFGLTRAWEMAGASGVISTRWPVRDSEGEMFGSFYRDLQMDSIAQSLRRSQIEMIHSGTWRAQPAYWASYELTGSAR